LSDYVEFWRDFYKEMNWLARKTRVLLGFKISQNLEGPVATQLAESHVQFIGSVPERELVDHLALYRAFYDLRENKVPEVAANLIERYDGRFAPIYAYLNELAFSE
jgi:hypothetical protein